MYNKLENAHNLVDTVFDIINAIDDLETYPNGALLEEIMAHCIKNTEGSRYQLLSFVNTKTSSLTFNTECELINCLKLIYQNEFGVIEHDPFKVEIKKQIDSLSIDPDPKDDLVNLILQNYLINDGIHAFLITGRQRQASTVRGSNLFLPIQEVGAQQAALLLDIVEQIREIIQSHPEVDRMFFIIRQQTHYMVIDFKTSMRQCFIMDAAGDARQLNFLGISEHIPEIETVIYVKNDDYTFGKVKKSTSLQKDMVSCSIFSLDHVLSAGRCTELHEKLRAIKKNDEGRPNIGYITWLDAPPELVRNAQSPTFRSKYLQLQPEASQYLNENGFTKTMQFIKDLGEQLIFFPDSPSPTASLGFATP